MSTRVLLNLLNPLEKRISCIYLYYKKYVKKNNLLSNKSSSVNTKYQFN